MVAEINYDDKVITEDEANELAEELLKVVIDDIAKDVVKDVD